MAGTRTFEEFNLRMVVNLQKKNVWQLVLGNFLLSDLHIMVVQ